MEERKQPKMEERKQPRMEERKQPKKEEKDFIDLYSLTELSKKDNHHPLTIRNWKKYIKVRYQTARSRAWYRLGEYKTPYTYKYIRREDVKKIMEKQTWKKIDFI